MGEVDISNGPVDVDNDFDRVSQPYDDVQIDFDKESFSGMDESSTDDEEEVYKEVSYVGLGDKEVGDYALVVKEKEVVVLILVIKRRMILIAMMTNIAFISHQVMMTTNLSFQNIGRKT